MWQAGRGGRSASGVIPPLTQEPIGSNFAFALEERRGGVWGDEWHAHPLTKSDERPNGE